MLWDVPVNGVHTSPTSADGPEGVNKHAGLLIVWARVALATMVTCLPIPCKVLHQAVLLLFQRRH